MLLHVDVFKYILDILIYEYANIHININAYKYMRLGLYL
jgi:hypothetical protein